MEGFSVALLAAVFAGLTIVALAVMARRVLGVDVGWVRAILVGVVVVSVGDLTLQVVSTRTGFPDPGRLDVPDQAAVVLLLALTVAWTFALGLLALVALEMVLPTGTLPPPGRWVRGWGARRRRLARYAAIFVITLRHGLGRYLRGGGAMRGGERARTARALRRALEDAGVTFVKLGQNLATRADLLAPEFVAEFSALHSDVAAEPWEALEPVLAAELGRPPEQVFEHVEPTPLAAASVGQVHRARLVDGTRVVVKLQRPGARAQILADLDILDRLAARLVRRTTWARSIGLDSLAAGFAASLREELDYRIEADNVRAVAAALPAGSAISVPATYPDLSGERLLVMAEVDGVPLTRARAELAALPLGERRALAESVLAQALHQLLVSGVFHADLHPGNLMLCDDGSIVMLDFGSVGRLDDVSRSTLAFLLAAVDSEDTLAAADALVDLLGRPDELDERALERDLGTLLVRFRGRTGGVGAAGPFTDLLSLVLRYGFRVPPQLAAAFRSLAALEGTLDLVDPTFDLVDGARAAARDLARDRLDPAHVRAALERQAAAALPMLQRLPRRLSKVLDQVESGRLGVSVRVFAHPDDRSFVAGLVDQAVIAVLAAAATLGAVLLLVNDVGPRLTPTIGLYAFLGYVLLFFGMVLALRVLVRALFRSRAPDDHAGR